MNNKDDDDHREERALQIQRFWRERRAVTDVQRDLVEDTAQLEAERGARLVQEYRGMWLAREKLFVDNAAWQRRLSHYFHEKKGQEADKAQAEQSSTIELENRYITFLNKIHDERHELDEVKRSDEESLAEYRIKLENHKSKADDFEGKFKEYKRQKCLKAEFTRTGKTLPAKRVEQFDEEEDIKNTEVRTERIKYIKMRNRMNKLAHLLKEKEKLTDGLHLIDFEQLKIENTTLNEKIEERNEDLLKLKKKATTTIHILTHVKEKLQFIQGENQGLKKQLAKLETELADHRDRLTQVKRDRDVLVNDNVKMREKMPMVGAEDLLVDYEHRKKEIERLRSEVVGLKNRHHELFVWIAEHTQPDLGMTRTGSPTGFAASAASR